MSNVKYTVQVEYVRKMLSYCEITGIFTRKTKTRGANIGDIAGNKGADGYVRIRLYPYAYPAHTLAWLHYHGEWPEKNIDHIDGNRSNNSIMNLRLANQSENTQNLKKARINSKTGLLGVSTQRNGYIASICVNGVSHYLGWFKEPQSAHIAYMAAKQELHPFSTL